MALTPFQRDVCWLLADQRKASGESYVAGGAALNELTSGTRVSRDIDLFHDTREAFVQTWSADQSVLRGAGYVVETVMERPTFVEALVRRGNQVVRLQWTHDSAFRFFPLMEHPEMGLVLHPFDLATNKVLALVGGSKRATGSIRSSATTRSSHWASSHGRAAERIRDGHRRQSSTMPHDRRATRHRRSMPSIRRGETGGLGSLPSVERDPCPRG